MPFDVLIPFVLTCILIELTPGPNMTYLALISSLEGKKAGFSIVAGVALGLILIGLVALSGAAIILEHNTLYQVIRWGGVLYLLWLAYDVWAARTEKAESANGRRYFMRGLITNLLNPKAAMFYITVFPALISKEGSAWLQFLPMIAIYVATATVIHLTIVLFGSQLHPFFINERRAKQSRLFFAVGLVFVAVWFGFSTVR